MRWHGKPKPEAVAFEADVFWIAHGVDPVKLLQNIRGVFLGAFEGDAQGNTHGCVHRGGSGTRQVLLAVARRPTRFPAILKECAKVGGQALPTSKMKPTRAEQIPPIRWSF